MKTEYPYFGYCPDSGFETFKTAEEAKAYADQSIDGYRDYAACDGWDECVENACWGLIKQKSTQVDKREPDIDKGEDDSFDYICDYQLRDVGEKTQSHVSLLDIRKLIGSEVGDFFAGLGNPGEPEKEKQ